MADTMELSGEVELQDREFTSFRNLIYQLAGISLSPAKHALVQARLSKRLRKLQVRSFTEYLKLVAAPNSPELESFINSLTTNKTEFFRESHHFDFLHSRLFREIKEQARSGSERKVRLWCAASSSGEEPYSLAMALKEEFGDASGWDLRILATDIDTDMLRHASAGCYAEPAIESLPGEYRRKYLVRSRDGKYAIRDDLKELVTFRRLNLNQTPWPIHTCFDAIFCRNVMIYFDAPTQHALVDHLSDMLRPGGYLMIGHSESLLGFACRLESLGGTIYRAPQRSGSSTVQAGHVLVPNEAVANSLVPPPVSNTDLVAASPPSVQSVSAPMSMPRPALARANVQATSRSTTRSSAAHRNDDCPPASSRYLIVGEYHASQEPCLISTTLGSCIAACLYEPRSGIGGMNHFLLPESRLEPSICASYGIHAMELLINSLMKLGAPRNQLRAKIFGGASVIGGTSSVWNVGVRNVEFIRKFLAADAIPVDAEYVGGGHGMKIDFNTRTTRTKVKLLDNKQASVVFQSQAAECKRFADQLRTSQATSVTLF